MAVVHIYTHKDGGERVELRTELRFEWLCPKIRPLKYFAYYMLGDRYGTEGEYWDWVHSNRERARKWGWTFK